MKISLSELRELTTKALQKQGYSVDETKTIGEVLLYAQLRGNNQGVVKLTGKGIPKALDVGVITLVKETKLSALMNGAKNHAMVVVNRATDLAITKAKEHGVGLVGIQGTCTSSGAIGYYAKKIAQAGLVGLDHFV